MKKPASEKHQFNAPEPNIYEAGYVMSAFNAISGSYEQVNNLANWRLPVYIRRKIISGLGQQRGDFKILDLMSGCGENWKQLAKQYPDAELVAVDISHDMLAKAAESGKKLFGKDIRFIRANIFEADLPTGYFDLVICSFGLKCLPAQQYGELIRLAQRCLKTDGKYLFIEVSKPNNNFLCFLLRMQFKYILPLTAVLFRGDHKPYRMLWQYLDTFTHTHFLTIAKQKKLCVHSTQHLFGSIITFKNYA